MNETKVLNSSECERDLGVMIARDLKWGTQAKSAALKGNKMLGMLKRAFVSRDVDLWSGLYKSLVRPHLEYAVQAWSPSLSNDKNILEDVQKRLTKIPMSLRFLKYEERLKKMGLTTLSERRMRGDLIEMFKVMRCNSQITWNRGPKLTITNNSNTPAGSLRGHKLRLVRETFPARLSNDHAQAVRNRHNFFLNRVIPYWNKLPEHVVWAKSVDAFKKSLDEINQRGCYSLKPFGY